MEQLTQWRLAPPRWLSRVPYPFWTNRGEVSQSLPVWAQAQKLPAGAAGFVISLARCKWFGPENYKGGISSIRPTGELTTHDHRGEFNAGYARSMLDAQVRRQCQGRGGMWFSPDDKDMPAGLKDSFEPW